MAEREVRYCTTEDGVRIAYCVEGEGPALVYVPAFVASFASRMARPTDREYIELVGEGCTRVYFDHRGTGLSQREVADISLEAHVSDVVAVVRLLELRKVSVFALGIGGPVSLAYSALHADKVAYLVLNETFPALTDIMTVEQLRAFAELCRTNWSVAARTFSDLAGRELYADFALDVGKAYEEGASGEHMARLIESAIEWDGSAYFSSIKAKTLVLHRESDSVFPFSAAQKMAAGIRGARLVPLKGTSPYYSQGDVAPVVEAVQGFLPKRNLRQARAPRADVAAFRTVLFTDLVGHTEMMQRLGDEQGRAVLREHERITRETLKAHSGVEVKTMGDGFMASFGSVTKALECAIALLRAVEAWNAEGEHAGSPLQVRVGLNAGEPIAEEGDLFGSTVILASRVAAQAGTGEILIPEPVRHLLAGKDFLYADRGDVVLKGFEDAVRLYEVRWREETAS